jgi:hypothetical protein
MKEATMIDVMFTDEEVRQIVGYLTYSSIAGLEDEDSPAHVWDSAKVAVAILDKIEAVYPKWNQLYATQDIATLRAMMARRESGSQHSEGTLKLVKGLPNAFVPDKPKGTNEVCLSLTEEELVEIVNYSAFATIAVPDDREMVALCIGTISKITAAWPDILESEGLCCEDQLVVLRWIFGRHCQDAGA